MKLCIFENKLIHDQICFAFSLFLALLKFKKYIYLMLDINFPKFSAGRKDSNEFFINIFPVQIDFFVVNLSEKAVP